MDSPRAAVPTQASVGEGARATHKSEKQIPHLGGFGMTMALEVNRWPIQAWFWLEWGSSTAGQSLPAARSRFRAVHSDSISTPFSQPVA